MNNLLSIALLAMIALTAVSSDAYAKRLGGGKSFGKQREALTQPAPAPAPAAAPAAAGAAPAMAGKSWAGPLAGLAAGGLLAALFFGGAFEGIKPMDILLIALIAVGALLLFRALRRDVAPPAMQYAGVGGAQLGTPALLGGGPASPPATSRPDWFEDEPFLRAAKGHFLRLQEAWDRGDLNDIREYTTPEMFAELQLQLAERGATANHTEVIHLKAERVEVVTEGDLVIASVRFSGLIREEEHGDAQPFAEIWHIQKSAADRAAPWYVAGIQQAV